MTVYIVMAGEDYEHGAVLGVFSTFKLAEQYVEGWIKDRYRSPEDGFRKTHEDIWHDEGCNWIRIREYEVDL